MCFVQLGVFVGVQYAAAHDTTNVRLLVCTSSTNEYAASNEAAREFFDRVSVQHRWSVTITSDPLAFQYDSLKKYAAIVFVNNVGETVDRSLRGDVERYVREGGGAVLIHASVDANPTWEFYRTMSGVRSQSTAPVQDTRVHVLDEQHPSTTGSGTVWRVRDRVLNLGRNLREYAHVLAAYDSQSIQGGTMGLDHPVSWCSQIQQGRSWVTTLGFEPTMYVDTSFTRHLEQGIRWAAHLVEGDASAFRYQAYSTRTIARLGGVVSMTSLPNRKLLVATRRGEFYVIARDGSSQRRAGELPVAHRGEDGTLGVTLELRRTDSAIVYVLAADSRSDELTLRRVVLDHDTIVTGATRTILSFPYESAAVYHVGGGLALNRTTGDLFIGTGDNTHADGLGGYPGLDERPSRSLFDAQRTASNTMSLRGKVLRIRPRLDGTGYDIPEGNLYPNGTDSTRPEIFAMGLRNPFRIAVDSNSGTLCVGDVGPNPYPIQEVFGRVRGVDELNVITRPANLGWPYFVGNNEAFHRVDMGPPPVSLGPNNPTTPINTSPNNTGRRVLPPAVPSTYAYADYDEDSALCGRPDGRSICAGPRVDLQSRHAIGSLPLQLHGYWLLYDFARGWVRCFRTDSAGQVVAGFPLYLRPDSSAILDLELTDDGELFALLWDDPQRGDARARVVQIEWSPAASSPPAARIQTDVLFGMAPLSVQFDGRGSRGRIASYQWDFDGDGEIDSDSAYTAWTYRLEGTFSARLTVLDSSGATTSAATTITVGNTPPRIDYLSPSHGMVYREGSPVSVSVSASDDHTPTSELAISVTMLLGHDNHAHPVDEQFGGIVDLHGPVLRNHGSAQQMFALVTVRVRDRGNEPAGALELDTSIVLQPHIKEAEYSTTGYGSIKTTSPLSPAMAGIRMQGSRANWFIFPLRLDSIRRIRLYGVASTPLTVRYRFNAVDGPEVAEPAIWTSSARNTTPIVLDSRIHSTPDSMHTLYVVLEGDSSDAVFIDALEFINSDAGVDSLRHHRPSLAIENRIVVTNALRFTIRHRLSIPATASVVSLLGSVIATYPCSTNYPFEIPMNTFPAGTYLLHASTEHGDSTVTFNLIR